MCCVLCIIVFCVVCCDSQCSPQAGQQQEVCKCVVEEEVGPQLAQSNPFQGGRATVKILAQLVQKHMLVQIHNWCKYTTGANKQLMRIHMLVRREYTLATSKEQEHSVSLMLNAIQRL